MLNLDIRSCVVVSVIAVVSCISVMNVAAQSSFTLLNADGSAVASSLASDARLASLRKDLHPGIYFRDGEMNLREQSATTLFTDVASLGNISKETFASSGIEMVTVQVNAPSELASPIDLATFNDYARLKYVQVLASFPCSKDDLYRMLKNSGGQYLILLSVDPVN